MMPMTMAAMMLPIMAAVLPVVGDMLLAHAHDICQGEQWHVLLLRDPAPGAQRPREPRRPRHHHLLDLRRAGQPRPVPGDPLHARGVRRRGAADRRRGRRDDPHPRAPAGRDAVATRSRTSGRSPRRSAPRSATRRSSTTRPARSASRVEQRIAYLRELRPEVAALNMGSMNYAKYSRARKDFVFQAVFANPFDEIIDAARGDERARHQARARVLRLGHVGSLEPLLDMGVLRPAAARRPASWASSAASARRRATSRPWPTTCPAGVALGRHRDLPAPVDARRRGADARRLRPRRAGGQLLPPRRHDGPLERRPHRQGPADGAGRGARLATVDEARALGLRARRERLGAAGGADARRACRCRPRAQGPRPVAAAARAASARCCWPTSARTSSRSRTPGWATTSAGRRPPSRAPTTPPRGRCSWRSTAASAPSGSTSRPRAGARRCCAWPATPTCCSSPSGPACSTASASAGSALREVNPGLVYCAITGYGQTGPLRDRSGHDLNYLGLNGLLGADRRRRRAAGAGRRPDRRPRRRRAHGRLRDPAALRHRDRTGEGQLVDVSMFDGALSWLAMVAARVFAAGERPRRGHEQLGGLAPLLPPLPVRRRLGHAGRARAEVLARVVRGRRARGPRRAPVRRRPARPPTPRWRRSSRAARGPSGRPSRPSTTAAWSRCSSSRRRSPPSSCARERWCCRASSSPGPAPVRGLGFPVKLSATPGRGPPRRPRAGRAHARGPGRGRLRRRGAGRLAGRGRDRRPGRGRRRGGALRPPAPSWHDRATGC